MKASSAETDHPQNADAQKPRVLIVDDDLRIRQGLQLNLQKSYRVQLCASGEEGIQAVRDDVDVMVLDIKMPGKDGLQVYEAVKSRFPDLPIIFYSAYQSVLEGARFNHSATPYYYIDKSADVQELLDTIDRAATHSQALRQARQPA